MVKIASAGNYDTACYGALFQKGYQVSIIVNPDGKTGLYKAEKDQLSFIGESPIETFGLVALYELRGENWYNTREEYGFRNRGIWQWIAPRESQYKILSRG